MVARAGEDELGGHIRSISLRALGLLLDLKGIGQMLENARFLSLNAKISSQNLNIKSSSFSSMVVELNRIVFDLNSLFQEVDRFSWNVSTRVADCTRARTRLHQFGQALALSRRTQDQHRGGTGGTSGIARLRSAALRSASASPQAAGGVEPESVRRFRTLIEERMEENRKTIDSQLARLSELVSRLSVLIEEIVDVAVQRIHLIALSSMIESTATEMAQTNLPNIARHINGLAMEMAAFGNRVNVEIGNLSADIDKARMALRGDGALQSRKTA